MLALPKTEDMRTQITIRPSVAKTITKGAIAIVMFSLFLEVTPSKLLNFLIFIAISMVFVLAYACVKKTNEYVLTEKNITLRSLLHGEKVINYSDITGLSISQGILAKRFGCGTIFIDVRTKPGAYAVVGGGMAEALRDVKDPSEIFETISTRLERY